MNYLKHKKIACIGIGGGGVFYVAKFFLKFGAEVYGFDIKESARTQELQKLGARITFANPSGKLEPETTLFVYSPGLPTPILQNLREQNDRIASQDVGEFYTELIAAFKNNTLKEREIEAFRESGIAPLFSLDQSKMIYIAVTGTDGKTTTCTMIYHILTKLGYKPGLISTVSAKIGDKEIDTGFHTTTPSSQELYELLKQMEIEHCTHAIVETTSHGLAMGRLAGLKFHAVVYTNITSEHLDYHKTWHNYYHAKELLITEHTTQDSIVILNKDDTKSYKPLNKKVTTLGLKHIDYSIKTTSSATYTAQDISAIPTLSFSIEKGRVHIPIIGVYNVSNALGAIALVSEITNKKTLQVAKLLEDFIAITGRMHIVQQKPFTVIVDFAHTTNALTQALKTARTMIAKGSKLIAVFGCAGQRDPSKRVPMGIVAGKLADITILTAEDPRAEHLVDINDEIEKGWRLVATTQKHLIRFDDDSLLVDVRRKAIQSGLAIAQPGDVVIITGKAHEQSLCFGTTEYPWSDIDEASKLISS